MNLIPTYLLACLIALTSLQFATADEAIEFFENKIRPVLVEHCYQCHSTDAKSVKGGLLLDTKQATRTGGDSGAAVIPKNPAESLLLSALRYEDYEMPPKGQLPDEVIADFEKWIAMGAPDPREGQAAIKREIDIEAGRDFWAFQPLATGATPSVENKHWPRTQVDEFILSRIEKQGLTPIGDADSLTWLRRVSFDLIGLPPTTKQIADFLDDESEDARLKVVDRLLQSQHFGERWGRHWLDVARYAESTGRTRNYPFPFAWRYRDYVIESFNADKPLDQFIIEQIAGDLLDSDDQAERESQLVATGFLAVGSPDLNERNQDVFKMDMVADQIDTVGRSLLGLTVGCARCHDHKFDPIPTDDYYALAGIFRSTDLLNGYASKQGGGNLARADLLIKLGDSVTEPTERLSDEELLIQGLDKKKAKQLLAAKALVDEASAKMRAIRKNTDLDKKQRDKQVAKAKRVVQQKNRQLVMLRNRFARSRKIKIEGPHCLGVRESREINNCKVHIRGDTKKLGDEVPRGFLQVVATSDSTIANDTSGRLELAQWIASADNPLTARVYVNRVWRHLFGEGIVRTVDNFGEMGARPSHPELLDHLANEFVANGWSTKELVRQLVLSRTYGLAVTYDEKNALVDEDNMLLWRMNSRRLDYESMRDALLLVSGQLERNPPTGSYVETLNVNQISKRQVKFDYESNVHRSVYLPVMRGLLPDEMSYFDFPDGSETRGARDVTTVPTQSLYLLNSPFVVDLAKQTAKSLLNNDPNDERTAKRAYRRILGRDATDKETTAMVGYVEQRAEEIASNAKPQKSLKKTKKKKKLKNKTQVTSSREAAWSEAIHAMFASAEFRYR